ncbi:Crp/Fnr family transcriptional regulator [Luteimonas sp. R10]|uniref:Crp/Fnr family transcriptional regulator n=1 Tax=Luteimonas sp. R10 TaxID=3108176 RepID=UPI00309263EE|nr:Crp/Fnr family transcriptional regulator [Luteimonas sp. R10]
MAQAGTGASPAHAPADARHLPGRAGVRGNALALEASSLFQGLPAPVRDYVLANAVECTLDDGNVLFSKNDAGDFLALVLSGQVYKLLYGPDGQELIMGSVEQGGTVDATVLVDRQVRSFTAVARGPTRILKLLRRHFPVLLSEPLVVRRAHAALCLELRRAIDDLENMCLHRLESRLARCLLLRLREQGGARGTVAEVVLPPTQGILAAMVNASRSKLNAQLQCWHRSGIISCGRHVLRINDLEALRLKARLAPEALSSPAGGESAGVCGSGVPRSPPASRFPERGRALA